MTDHWAKAVEAWCVAMYGNDIDQPDIDRAMRGILAAAPHLERHFREKLAEELRQENRRLDDGASLSTYAAWELAALHLTRPEVMG